MNNIRHCIVTYGVILSMVGMLTGCAAEEVAAPEGYEDIDTDLADVEEEAETAEDMHMAEAVPYTGDEKEEAEAPEEEETEVSDEEEPAEEFLPGYPTEKDWKERHTGSVSYIWEPTVLVSIFVNEEEDFWTEEEKQVVLNNCNIAY